MKTKEELKALKDEYQTLAAKLSELSEEELIMITGGEIAWGTDVAPDLDPHYPTSWNNEKKPTDAGNYKLDIDVELNDNWKSND